MEKRYTYIYNGCMSPVRFSEEEIINRVTKSGFPQERYSILELVRVKLVPSGYKVERA